MSFTIGQLVVHLRSEKEYFIKGLPTEYFIESSGEPAYVYVDPTSGKHWVRGQSEMEDGRFVIKNPPDHHEAIELSLKNARGHIEELSHFETL